MSAGQADPDALLRALFAAAPWGLAFLDRELRYVLINETLARENGRSVADHRGRSLREVLGTMADQLEPILHAVIEDGLSSTGVPVSGATTAAPGVVRHWSADYHPVLGADGAALGVLAAVHEDTAARELENAVRSTVGELQPSETGETPVSRDAQLRELARRLADAQAVAHLGTWEWSIASGKLAWSDEIFRLFGLDRATVAPTFALYLSLLHPADRASVEVAFQRAVEERGELDEEYRLIRPDGEVRRVHSHGQVSIDARGAAIRMTGNCLDVTDRRHIEARLQVTDRLAAIGTLAGGIAHELNNPLGYVVGNLGFVTERLEELRARLEQAVAAPQAAAFVTDLRAVEVALADARQGAERIRTIVKDINRFARIDDDHSEPVRVHDVIEAAVRLAWNEIKHRARVVRDYGEPPLVEANPSRLGQVVLDLLLNAAQAIEEGKRDDNEIRICTQLDGHGSAAIEIRDTGCGIRPEILGRIFDPFFTTKPLGASTGLGLSVCHRLITVMGGTLDVTSEPGRGSVFRVVLPATAAQAADATPGGPGAVSRRLRVLAIDDEPMLLKFYQRMIGREHEIVALTSAAEALERLAGGERFDVILCDLMMPQVTGWEFHAQVALRHPDQLDRIVFITGGAFTPRGRTFLDGIPNQWVEKPIDPRQLASLLRSRSA